MDVSGTGANLHTPDGQGFSNSNGATTAGAATMAGQPGVAAAAAGVRWSLPASGGDSSYDELSTAELRAMGPATVRDPALQFAPAAAASADGAEGPTQSRSHAHSGRSAMGARVHSALMAAAPQATPNSGLRGDGASPGGMPIGLGAATGIGAATCSHQGAGAVAHTPGSGATGGGLFGPRGRDPRLLSPPLAPNDPHASGHPAGAAAQPSQLCHPAQLPPPAQGVSSGPGACCTIPPVGRSRSEARPLDMHNRMRVVRIR